MAHYLDEDVALVHGTGWDRNLKEEKTDAVVRTLFWGEELELPNPQQATNKAAAKVDVRYYNYPLGKTMDGHINKKKSGGNFAELRLRDKPLLEVTFVDVQQGDATIIRTPARKLILVDGGEEKFVARLLASMFPGTTAARPLDIDALVVSHGDADHFTGLNTLLVAQGEPEARKRLFCRIHRFFHSGLVKLPKGTPEKGMFGKNVKSGGRTYATELWDDPRDAPVKNEPFKDWCATLDKLLKHNGAVVKRIEFGTDKVFKDFDIGIGVLGPFTETIDGGPALRFLRNEEGAEKASHTINGHSVVLKLTYKNINFLLGGDLNIDGSHFLLENLGRHPAVSLRSEVMKVPHHGSHEYAPELLEKVNAVISIVSSGDESKAKDYVHPRANLMAALGRYSRGESPLVYVTELAAFFAQRGTIAPEQHREKDGKLVPVTAKEFKSPFFAFERLVFGAVYVRTDGERIVCGVESASDSIKEAYAFRVDAQGKATPDELRVRR